MSSDQEREFPFEMWPPFLSYLQAFEQHHQFQPRGPDCEDPEMSMESHFWFVAMRNHPVEIAVESAAVAAVEDDLAKFKTQRRIAIEYLEPQYQRMTTAWKELKDYALNDWKTEIDGYWTDSGVLVGRKMFKRDIPAEVELDISDQKNQCGIENLGNRPSEKRAGILRTFASSWVI